VLIFGDTDPIGRCAGSLAVVVLRTLVANAVEGAIKSLRVFIFSIYQHQCGVRRQNHSDKYAAFLIGVN